MVSPYIKLVQHHLPRMKVSEYRRASSSFDVLDPPHWKRKALQYLEEGRDLDSATMAILASVVRAGDLPASNYNEVIDNLLVEFGADDAAGTKNWESLIKSIVYRYYPDHHELEDRFQDIFVDLFLDRDNKKFIFRLYDSERLSFSSFLQMKVRNLLLDMYRHEKSRREVLLPESLTPTDSSESDSYIMRNLAVAFERKERYGDLRDIMKMIKAADRTPNKNMVKTFAFLLSGDPVEDRTYGKDSTDITYSQIAEHLGVAVSRVATYVKRITNIVREHFEKSVYAA